jgi:two-component system sensor histidine kinase HydH
MWKKVVAPTLLVSVLWMVASGGTTFYIHWLYDFHQRLLSENVTTIRAAADMRDILWQIQNAAVDANAFSSAAGRKRLAELETAFARHLQEAGETSQTTEEQTQVKAIKEHYQIFCSCLRARQNAVSSPALPASAPDEELNHLAWAVAQPCKRLLDINTRLLSESGLRGTRLATSVTVVRTSFLVAGPLIGILLGIFVARGLHQSVSQISVTLKDATGELEEELGRVDLPITDELPGLKQQVEVVSSQIKRVVAELQNARREVIRSERLAAVGELAAGVAHELRNPLTSVKLLVQTAAQRFPERPLNAQQLEVILQEVVRLENTIQSLLDFARPPALRHVRHDLRETLRRALNLTQGLAGQDGVVIAGCWPEESLPVDADPEQLHQVFVNLLLNAIEAMPHGGTLQVSSRRDEASGTCCVMFSDSGPGISPSVMPRLFEPFVTDKQRGTGLGLAISHRIVREHHGTLLAVNRPEGGAVLTVQLPLARETPVLSATPSHPTTSRDDADAQAPGN